MCALTTPAKSGRPEPQPRGPLQLASGSPRLNHRVLVTDAAHLHPKGINAHERTGMSTDRDAALAEHQALVEALTAVGITVEQISSPPGCQDGVFTANWGLTWNGRALLAAAAELASSGGAPRGPGH